MQVQYRTFWPYADCWSSPETPSLPSGQPFLCSVFAAMSCSHPDNLWRDVFPRRACQCAENPHAQNNVMLKTKPLSYPRLSFVSLITPCASVAILGTGSGILSRPYPVCESPPIMTYDRKRIFCQSKCRPNALVLKSVVSLLTCHPDFGCPDPLCYTAPSTQPGIRTHYIFFFSKENNNKHN